MLNFTWNDVFVCIRAVEGKRQQCLKRLIQSIDFTTAVSTSFHKDGRSVPESYADALSLGLQSGKEWCLQLEDDAILRHDFSTHAIRLLNECHDSGLSFASMYSGRRVVANQTIDYRNPSLEILPGSRFLMAQAFFIKCLLIADHNKFMLDFCSNRPFATDTATAAWMRYRKMRYGRSWPSIVQHDDVPSLYGHHRNPNRFAWSFSDEC